MEQFPGDALVMVGMVLETIKCGWAQATPLGDAPFSDNVRLLTPQEREHTEQDLRIVEQRLRQCGLTTSCEALSEFRSILLNWKIAYFARLSAQDVIARIEEVERTIRREIKSVLLVRIPPERALRFNKDEDFGPAVAQSFPSAKFDITESGNCYAAGRFTACVFHLMRALEIALDAFGGVFGLKMSHTNWQPFIDQVEAKIREYGKSAQKDKDRYEFYSQAASSFMIFKDAWRNYTAHTRGKYTEEEADTIYRNVGAFMQRLAQGGIRESL